MDALLDEVESLEAILMEDVNVTRNIDTGTPEIIETIVFPTVGGDTDRQYVCVTLQVLPKPGYPDVSPEFNLQRPRGLDDKRLADINEACVQKINVSQGYPVVFDLIDVIREHLTGSNLPSGQCVVCLYGFQEGDEFTKTECYHYLHSYCLARHLIASKKNYQEEHDKLPLWQKKLSKPYQAVCPVCREPINDNIDHLSVAAPPMELDQAPDFQLTDELKNLQMKMASLFLDQKIRGGIIDLTADETNIISIEPESQNGDEHNSLDEEIEGLANENRFDNHQNSATQSTTQQNQIQSRSGQSHQHQQSRNNPSRIAPLNRNNNLVANNNTAQRQTVETPNNNHSHNHHYRRGHGHNHHHHHHHHRSRRHHNHHQHNDDSANQPQKANANASSSSSTR